MGLQRTVPPTVYAVSLEEAKAWCRIRHSEEDGLINSLIKSASEHIENSLNLSIANQTWKLSVDAFTDAIELLRGPLVNDPLVEYIDADGNVQPLDPGYYTVDNSGRSPWIVGATGTTWPETLDAVNAVMVTYEAGTPEVERERLKQAVLFLVSHWYTNRLPGKMDPGAIAIVEPYRQILV